MEATTVRPVTDKREFKQFIDYQYDRNLCRDVPPVFTRLAEKVRRGFVAPTDAEFKPIACAVAVADVTQALRGTDGRLFPLLTCELYKLVRDSTRYKRVEFSWVLEDNHAINQTVERMGAVHYQTYRIYQKALM